MTFNLIDNRGSKTASISTDNILIVTDNLGMTMFDNYMHKSGAKKHKSQVDV